MMKRALLFPVVGAFCVVVVAGCNQLDSSKAGGQSGALSGSILDQYAPTGPGGISLFPTWQDLQRWEEENPRPLNQPSWSGALLGRVQFANTGFGSVTRDLRRNAEERAEYSINPEGEIGADDFLGILRPGPVEFTTFERTMQMVNFQGDIRAEYQKYLNNIVPQGLGLLTMNRIIDNESMKKKLPRYVSDERVDYLARAVVIRNATALGKIEYREENVLGIDGQPLTDASGRPVVRRVVGDHPSASVDSMYDWFREAVNNRSFCLNMDWKFDDGGLADDLADLSRAGSGQLPYPELTLEFRCGAPVPAQCSNRKRTVLVTQKCLPGVEQADLAKMLDEQALYEGLFEPRNQRERDQFRTDVAAALEQSKPADLAAILASQDKARIEQVATRALNRLASNLGRTFNAADKATAARRAAESVVRQDTSKFKETLKEMLHPLHRSLRRQAAWGGIIREAYPDAANVVNFSVTPQESDRLYDLHKERMFYRLSMTATYHEFTVSGAKAQDFERRFVAIMTEKQRELVRELNAGGAPTTDEERARRRERVLEARRTVPVEVFQQLQTEFAQDIAAGAVRLERFDRSMNHVTGLVNPSSEEQQDSVENRFRGNFFDAAFAQLPYAITVVPGAQGRRHIGVLKAVSAGEREILPKSNEMVRSTIRAMITSKAETWVMREVAFRLLRANRFRKVIDTCSDQKWPCMGDMNAERMVLALFPERLYDGERLRQEHFVTYANGSTVPTGPEAPHTLGRRQELHKVQEISTQIFRRVFDIENPGS